MDEIALMLSCDFMGDRSDLYGRSCRFASARLVTANVICHVPDRAASKSESVTNLRVYE